MTKLQPTNRPTIICTYKTLLKVILYSSDCNQNNYFCFFKNTNYMISKPKNFPNWDIDKQYDWLLKQKTFIDKLSDLNAHDRAVCRGGKRITIVEDIRPDEINLKD